MILKISRINVTFDHFLSRFSPIFKGKNLRFLSRVMININTWYNISFHEKNILF
jgi:hypothetical protein